MLFDIVKSLSMFHKWAYPFDIKVLSLVLKKIVGVNIHILYIGANSTPFTKIHGIGAIQIL